MDQSQAREVGVFAWARRAGEASHIDGEIKMINYQGSATRFSVETDGTRIMAEVPADAAGFEPGQQRPADLAQVGHGHHGGRR